MKDENGDISGQTLAGIHSGGLGCGGLNVPAFWQRVSSYHYYSLFCNLSYLFCKDYRSCSVK